VEWGWMGVDWVAGLERDCTPSPAGGRAAGQGKGSAVSRGCACVLFRCARSYEMKEAPLKRKNNNEN